MSTQREMKRRQPGRESGAALIEFALLFPIFMTIVLGMFGGGQAYNRKIAMTNAVAEASRYGATLAPGTLSPPDPGVHTWLVKVADAVVQNAERELEAGEPSRRICVAYVFPLADKTDDAAHAETSHRLVRTTGDAPVFDDTNTIKKNLPCFDDGRPDDERRVQIEVTRRSPINALLFQYEDLTLTARSVTRFEATSF